MGSLFARLDFDYDNWLNLNAGLRGSLSDVLDAEALHMIRTFDTEDHKGAAVAFVEKRPPSFKGR